MKVALLTDSKAFAGTERHMLDLAHALRQRGVEAQLVCPTDGELAARARAEKVPAFGCDSTGLGFLSAILALRAKLISGEWDIIHSHNGRSALIAALARRWSHRGCLVATQHFIDPARTKRRGWRAALAKRIHRWVDDQTSGLIAISEAVKEALLVRDKTPDWKIHVVVNGIRDPTHFKLRSREEVRAELRIPANASLIVCICRLEPEKNVEVLVRAMSGVLSSFPQAVCVIGGSGSESDKIAAEIERFNLQSFVKLLGFQPDPHSLMRASTVFVLPSRAEPFGLALVEAMALHCPCVATRAGGPLEIITEEVSGVLVPPDDPRAMSLALQRLLSDADLRARLQIGARERFTERFTVDRMGVDIITAYLASLEYARL